MFEQLQLPRLIRYGYPGFLLVAIAAYFDHHKVHEMVSAAGTVVAPLVVFAIGACIYVLHRYVLGELIIYPGTHFIHWLLDCRSDKQKRTSVTGYLGSLKVEFGQRRSAYTDIRRGLFSDKQRERLDLDHTDAHIVWLTAVEFAGTAIYLLITNGHDIGPKWFFCVATIPLVISGIMMDIRQNRKEYQLLNTDTMQSKVIEFLKKKGYLSDGGPPGGSKRE